MIDKKEFEKILKQYIPADALSNLDLIYEKICRIEARETALPQPFFESLTPSEKKALKFILTLINYSEGTLIISKLIEQSQVSRAVITNLIAKIEKYRVMEIKSKGVKGTYFKTLIDFKNI